VQNNYSAIKQFALRRERAGRSSSELSSWTVIHINEVPSWTQRCERDWGSDAVRSHPSKERCNTSESNL